MGETFKIYDLKKTHYLCFYRSVLKFFINSLLATFTVGVCRATCSDESRHVLCMFHAQIPFDRIPHQFKSGPMCRSSQGESIINIIRACARCFKDNIFIPRAPFKKFLDCRWFSINYFKIMLNYFLEKSECLIHKDIFKRTFPCAACCGNSSVIA